MHVAEIVDLVMIDNFLGESGDDFWGDSWGNCGVIFQSIYGTT